MVSFSSKPAGQAHFYSANETIKVKLSSNHGNLKRSKS
jgi:hypothetical protein